MPRRMRPRRLRRLEFAIPQILTWADAFHERTGKWPQTDSGIIAEMRGETWRRVDSALRVGLRGLPGGSSLAQLLAEQRQVRNRGKLPPLKRQQVLEWADAYRTRTGNWPTSESGPIPQAPGETWRAVDQALRVGVRGLPGGSSLARFLARYRRVRNIHSLPPLSVKQILAWADAHHERTGKWPTSASGTIRGAVGETWKGVNAALTLGRRGLPGGSSLPRLLSQHRGVPNPKELPALTIKQVLTWARAHRRRTGQWPTRSSGAITEAPGETWSAVNAALATGCRGLPAGLTLAGLLAAEKAVPNDGKLPRLTIKQILTWADTHHERTGKWPHARSGPILDVPGETWRAIDQALRTNQRGLICGTTLVRLLTEKRGIRARCYPPPLREQEILAWAEAHHKRTGTWPTADSGPIPDAPGETWRRVDEALRRGARGLTGKKSLARFLADERGVRNRTSLPVLRLKQILAWADAHHKRSGTWPTSSSGPIPDAPGETWKGVDMALRHGHRGMRGGVSLARLLATRRGVRNRVSLPRLSRKEILSWARAHRQRTGEWPTRTSGPIPEAPGETWGGVELALRHGYRGLPGGSSLAQLCR